MPKYTLKQFLSIKDDWVRRVYHTPEEWADLLGMFRDEDGGFHVGTDTDGMLQTRGTEYINQSWPRVSRAAASSSNIYNEPTWIEVPTAAAPTGSLASTTIMPALSGYTPYFLAEEVYSGLGSAGSPPFYFGCSAGTGLLGGGPTTIQTNGASLRQWKTNNFSDHQGVLFKGVASDVLNVAGGSFAAADALTIIGVGWYE